MCNIQELIMNSLAKDHLIYNLKWAWILKNASITFNIMDDKQNYGWSYIPIDKTMHGDFSL